MFTLEQMLYSCVHLGHNVKKWNPKMAPYIFCKRNNIHIIDLLQTFICLEKTCRFLKQSRQQKKSLGFLIL